LVEQLFRKQQVASSILAVGLVIMARGLPA
jgi:hypothetical protein